MDKAPQREAIPKDQRTKLNKLSFQATLWLPTELAIEVGKALQNRQDAKSIFEILLLARKVLLDDETLPIDLTTFWEPRFEEKGDPIIASNSSASKSPKR